MSFGPEAVSEAAADAVSQPAATLDPVTMSAVERDSVSEVAGRLARILLGRDRTVTDPSASELEFEPVLEPRPLATPGPAPEVWAVDGGQALVADARCLQVFVTRSATVCFRDGRCVVEEEGPLRAHLLGTGETGGGAAGELPEGASVDVNLLRDRAEWEAVAGAVDRAAPGSVILLDGDLVPDWRIPPDLVPEMLARAAGRGVALAAVTKHSSLARGGAPLIGQLEVEAAERFGPRRRWWVPVGRTREGSRWPELQVVVARLDPDARYAFRVDLPAGADPEAVLGALAAVSDDAAFPGYPYPLSVADRLAACPGWLRAETWLALDEALEQAGVSAEARERAFDDRHRLMERHR
ncbi:MAG TPA: DNA double-strand break repair nuclease NurA [Acidimicrobiales bacterium]|nr:DNA double-strand break repair nuclease NurA [Acidimicrobiales bacterium]